MWLNGTDKTERHNKTETTNNKKKTENMEFSEKKKEEIMKLVYNSRLSCKENYYLMSFIPTNYIWGMKTTNKERNIWKPETLSDGKIIHKLCFDIMLNDVLKF